MVRRKPRAARRRPGLRPGRDRDASRPQRRRQDHDLAGDHGLVRQAHRLGRGDGQDVTHAAATPDRPRRRRLRAGGARHLRDAHGRGKPLPAAGGAQGRHGRSRRSTRCSRTCGSGGRAPARSFPAASSRCWRSPASCGPASTLILLDEPTEGLAPVIVQRIGEMIRTLKAARADRAAGRAEFPLRGRLADRFYVLEHGQVDGSASQRRKLPDRPRLSTGALESER